MNKKIPSQFHEFKLYMNKQASVAKIRNSTMYNVLNITWMLLYLTSEQENFNESL